MILQEDLDPQDQTRGASMYHDPEVIQQREDGILNRWEADLAETLSAKDVVFSTSSPHTGNEQTTRHDGQRVLISQIYLRCRWSDVPFLQQWITQFLAGRQPDASVIAAGMAKQGMTRIALDEQQAIEGYLIIGSTEQELHGSVAENVAEHLVSEGQISGYAVYSIPLMLR